MKLFVGTGCPLLGYRVSQKLETSIGNMELTQFSDGEISVELLEHVRGEDVFIIQSTCAPANDNVMELAIIADTVRRSDASRIVAVIPYYGYSRADRRLKFHRTPITSRLVADLLQASGISFVVAVDIHSDQQQGFFNTPFVNVSATPLFVNDIEHEMVAGTFKVVSPDIGGVKRARDLAAALGPNVELVIVDKDRPSANDSRVMNVIGDVDGMNCILIDDIADTAGTICKAAAALKHRGAKRVVGYCTHPVLSGHAVETINRSQLDELVVTDTIPLNKEAAESKKIRTISVSKLLSATIERIHTNRSVSELYKKRG